jgi:poly(3-hydroxybutyrate) depolymerase
MLRTLGILLAASGAAACAQAQSSSLNLTVGNQARTSLLYAPPDAVNPPLVISMHGLSGTGSQQRSMSRFETIAQREKFVVAFPDGLQNRWDIGGAVDVNFILALIDSAAARYGIDRARVYATGFSMGGMMSYHLANRAADRIAAIGPVGGFLLGNDPHNSSRPMPILHIHGDADTVVDYGRLANVLKGWATRNACPQTPQTVKPYPAAKPASKVTQQIWSPCDKSEIIALTVAGMGHGYTTGPDIHSSEEIWAFVKRYSLAGALGIRGDGTRTPALRTANAWYAAGRLHVRSVPGMLGLRIFDARGMPRLRWSSDGGVPAGGSAGFLALPFDPPAAGSYLVDIEGGGGRRTLRILLP